MIVRPDINDLPSIVQLAKKCIVKATGTQAVETQLEHFFKSAITNLSYFLEVLKEGDEVKGLVMASLQKQLYSEDVTCNVLYTYCEDGYEDQLDEIFDNGMIWARENKVKQIIFTEFDSETNSSVPTEFKKVGTIYGVEI